MSKIKISIVICTHNRSDLLQNAIQSVLETQYWVYNCELIIVDNNSNDSTRAVVEEFSLKYPGLRYILETNLGLSSARNRGWLEAQGEYVGYLDDDCKVSQNWLANALRVAIEITPEAFGGPYYAYYNTPKPRWFKDQYGSHVQGDLARPLQPNEYLDGGNMFIRRDLLALCGGFHTDMGMKGAKIAYGEETLFFKKLRANKNSTVLFYDPSIFIYHLVREDKMNLMAAARRFYAMGVYLTKIKGEYRQKRLKLLLSIVHSGWQAFLSFLYGLFARNRSKYLYFENYLYEVVFLWFLELGSLVEKFRGSLDSK